MVVDGIEFSDRINIAHNLLALDWLTQGQIREVLLKYRCL